MSDFGYAPFKEYKSPGQMSRFSLLMMALLLASCGVSFAPPPRDLDDACAIARERPEWIRDMERVERKWGVPVPVLMATIHQESSFRGDARTPLRFSLGVIPMGRQSSAYGFAQAIDSTWEWYQRDQGRSGARRERFSDAVDFMGWYFDQTEKRNGIAKTDARNQYLAYHDGHTGYARGTWRAKSWLIRVADRVADRAQLYDVQLRVCGRR